MPGNFEAPPPEVPEPEIPPAIRKMREEDATRASAEKAKEKQFTDRLSLLGFEREKMSEAELDKLQRINQKIEEADAPWVVRVMDRFQKENLLKSFAPSDVALLQKIAQEKGYNLKEGIVRSQVEVLTFELMGKKGGKRGAERIAALGETPKREAPPETLETKENKAISAAEANREGILKEISEKLIENPLEALSIFKKGVSLKLSRAHIEFKKFWQKRGTEVLKGMSFVSEKGLGRPASELTHKVWLMREWLEKSPGLKRLDKVERAAEMIELIKKRAATPEEASAIIGRLAENHKYAARDLLKEIEDFNSWSERKRETLAAIRTFGRLRERLRRWILIKEAEAERAKEGAKTKRASKIIEKLR